LYTFTIVPLLSHLVLKCSNSISLYYHCTQWLWLSYPFSCSRWSSTSGKWLRKYEHYICTDASMATNSNNVWHTACNI